MQNAECRMQNGRRRRRGVSILEVLFAILVTTIGLLGALAVFPVASAMARMYSSTCLVVREGGEDMVPFAPASAG